MTLKPDFDVTMRNISIALTEVRNHHLEPARLYMNDRTYLALNGIFQRAPITIIPEGRRRTPTIYGVRIAICDTLPDNEIDVAVKTI